MLAGWLVCWLAGCLLVDEAYRMSEQMLKGPPQVFRSQAHLFGFSHTHLRELYTLDGAALPGTPVEADAIHVDVGHGCTELNKLA